MANKDDLDIDVELEQTNSLMDEFRQIDVSLEDVVTKPIDEQVENLEDCFACLDRIDEQITNKDDLEILYEKLSGLWVFVYEVEELLVDHTVGKLIEEQCLVEIQELTRRNQELEDVIDSMTLNVTMTGLKN